MYRSLVVLVIRGYVPVYPYSIYGSKRTTNFFQRGVPWYRAGRSSHTRVVFLPVYPQGVLTGDLANDFINLLGYPSTGLGSFGRARVVPVPV